jgi:segregation and condensation protein B
MDLSDLEAGVTPPGEEPVAGENAGNGEDRRTAGEGGTPAPEGETGPALKNVVEAVLFVTPEPLSIKKLAGVVGNPPLDDLWAVIRELQREYEGRGVELAQVAGGFRFFSREEYAPWAKNVLPEEGPTRLSRAALEVLSVVAYRQPITRVAVEAVRGVNCDGVIRALLDRKLITTDGREEAPGRPFRYRTTRHFLLYFGLGHLDDLPPIPTATTEVAPPDAGLEPAAETPAAEAVAEGAPAEPAADEGTVGDIEPAPEGDDGAPAPGAASDDTPA